MRLLRFYIGQYRVLKELDLPFDWLQHEKNQDRRYYLDFLVGVNGTGKSTVLQLLGYIFSVVQQSYDALGGIPFILEYYLDRKGQKVRIATIDPQSKELLDRYFISTAPGLDHPYDAERPDKDHLKDAVDSELLPERVIAYTTGDETAWLAQTVADPLEGSSSDAIKLMKPEDRVLKEMPGWVLPLMQRPEGVETRFRLIRQEDLPLVALAGLVLHQVREQSPLQDVLKEARIQRLAGFSLEFDLTYASHEERNAIGERFGRHAARAIRSGGKVLLVFAPEQFQKVLEANGNSALVFFEVLADWHRRDPRLLSRVHLFLERTKSDYKESSPTPPLHTWEWLSDGERSFLARMCLFTLFGEVESLILLDEPEVHFNDFWKRHIVYLIDQVFQSKSGTVKSHVLIATHSSIALSDVYPDDILVLSRPDLFTDTVKIPSIQTFGADPSDIMIYVFGTPYAAGTYSVSEFERWLEEARKKPLPERRDFLQKCLEKVSPGYWSYRLRLAMEEQR